MVNNSGFQNETRTTKMNPGEHARTYQTKAQLRAELKQLKEAYDIIADQLVAAEAEIRRLGLSLTEVCDSRREWMDKCIAARAIARSKPASEPVMSGEELAIQMANWVDENINGLSQREAQDLEAEFKRLIALAPGIHYDAP
jgi:hypothetical protein